MRPFVRVKMLHSRDYKQLREMTRSRKLAAGKVKRAKIILLSNQGTAPLQLRSQSGSKSNIR